MSNNSYKIPSYGMLLMNEQIPQGIPKFNKPITKKDLQAKLSIIGKKHPSDYGRIVQAVKRIGDAAATYEGISVGLDDIEPDYARRDPIIRNAFKKLKKLSTTKNSDIKMRQDIIIDAQDALLDTVNYHKSDMAMMARSGGRGSISQLAKTVASPGAVTGADGSVVPWLIGRSYAEGLRPEEVWAANGEARKAAIQTKQSVADPGAFAKIMVANMSAQVVAKDDCRTLNGVESSTNDPSTVDRLLAKDVPVAGLRRNEVITPSDLSLLKKKRVEEIVVRSVLTCELPEGICQKCYGYDEKGQFPKIGTNMGVRSAQALSEPLTQFALNAKHGVRTASRADNKLKGLKGIQAFLEFPKSFTQKALVAPNNGTIQSVNRAPQGGYNIEFSPKAMDGGKPGGRRDKASTLYVAPGLDPRVKSGQSVYAGDILTSGVPLPNDVVPYKGLGAGRVHIAAGIQDIYKNSGRVLDKRHAELLAKSQLNYVRITEDPYGPNTPGDIVPYGPLHKEFTNPERVEKMALSGKLTGRILGQSVREFNAGTQLTRPIIDSLQTRGIKDVSMYNGRLKVTPIIKSLTRSPLLSPNWLAKQQHRYLRKSLTESAAVGATDTIHGLEPAPAYIFGAEFGQGAGGKY